MPLDDRRVERPGIGAELRHDDGDEDGQDAEDAPGLAPCHLVLGTGSPVGVGSALAASAACSRTGTGTIR